MEPAGEESYGQVGGQFTGQQQDPVEGEEDRGGQRLGEDGAELVFEDQAGQADRDGGQQSRCAEVSARRVRSVVRNAAMIVAQSRRSKTSSARAVATCRPTMNAR